MADSCDDTTSFYSGWRPIAHGRDAMLAFQQHIALFVFRPEVLYYYKPIETFAVSGLDPDSKFEQIDFCIARTFCCDPDEVITVSAGKFGPVVVMAENVLRDAGVRLPPWPEVARSRLRKQPHFTLVSS
jgi:hypothetical protein